MPGTLTDAERASGKFDAFKPTEADMALYLRYSVTRLRLLAWFGDPIARKMLEALR